MLLVNRKRVLAHSFCRCGAYVAFATALFFILASLHVVHILLLSRLDSLSHTRHSVEATWLQDDASVLYESLLAKLRASQVMDARGEYRIISRLVPPKTNHDDPTSPTLDDITLVSQCSANHLHRLLDLSSAWQGPISVTVFVSGKHLVTVLEVVAKLFLCNAMLLRNVTLHLVIPLTLVDDTIVKSKFSGDACANLPADLERLNIASSNYASLDTPYPNNLLRNVALDNSRTSYVLVVDIDMIPNAGLRKQFRGFVGNLAADSNERERIVFVIPAFELQESATIPADKRNLVRLWYKKLARPFYQELCWKCQRFTNYYAWRNVSSSSAQLGVGFEVEWKDPWEPFYIAPRGIPRYDERFKQYGFNRISQSCELHVAGYRFLVLDNAFLLHRGFKTARGFHASKEDEQNRNRLNFRQFKEGLKLKYPNSTLRCY